VLVVDGVGPYKYTNCASSIGGPSENWMSGGVQLFGNADEFLPRDIEIRGNYLTKPMDVLSGNNHKNHIEVKFGGRVLIEGNVTDEHNELGQQACFVIKMTDQNGANPGTNTHDVLLMSNRQRKGPRGIALTGREFSTNRNRPFRYEVRNNLLTPSTPTTGNGIGLNNGVDGIHIRWNTWRAPTGSSNSRAAIQHEQSQTADTSDSYNGGWENEPATRSTNIAITDNVLATFDGQSNRHFVSAGGGGTGEAMFDLVIAGPSVVERNLVNSGTANATVPNQVRVDATLAAIAFTQLTSDADLSLDGSSAGAGAGAGGRDIGAAWHLLQTIESEVAP
jgi:hypothetical protein